MPTATTRHRARPPSTARRSRCTGTASRMGLEALAESTRQLADRFPGIRFVDVIGELGGTNRYLSEEQLDRPPAARRRRGRHQRRLRQLHVVADARPVRARAARRPGDRVHGGDLRRRRPLQRRRPSACPKRARSSCPSASRTRPPRRSTGWSPTRCPPSIAGLTEPRTTIDDAARVRPDACSTSRPTLSFAGDDLLDAFDAMQRAFVAQRVERRPAARPADPAKVDAMIAASGRDGDDVVGDLRAGLRRRHRRARSPPTR